MSIRIEIGDKWVITSDQYQFILNEKKSLSLVRKLARNGSTLSVITRKLISLFPALFITTYKQQQLPLL